MRRTLLLFVSVFISILINAQAVDFSITSPDPLPDSLKFCMGESLTFTLNYDGWGYVRWQKCSEEPDFENYSNYNLWEIIEVTGSTNTISVTEEAYYWIWISEDLRNLFSEVFHIRLQGTIPTLVYAGTVFCEGSTMEIGVEPSNLGDGNYMWYKDGEVIENETDSILVISEPGSYKASALTSNDVCPGVFYETETVEFTNIKPEVYGDLKLDLNRLVLSTDAIYTNYQWYSGIDNNELTAIDGATSDSYYVNITSESIHYALGILTNSGCTAMSDTILVNDVMYGEPVITQPIDTFACRGDTILLVVENDPFLSYQWYRDGNSIWGAIENLYKATQGGEYNVIVTTYLDETDELTSNSISLAFSLQPVISVLNNATFCPGTEISLYTSSEYETYQWFINDSWDISNAVELTGETDSTINITVPEEFRIYFVKVSSGDCEDASNGKYVSEFVLYPPNISATPWEAKLCMGDTVELRSYANDVTFQWYRNDNEIDGATESNYYATDAGYFDLEITSTLCPEIQPVMNNDSLLVNYIVAPNFYVDPDGQQYGDNPNHRIFCNGDTISLILENATNYSSWQWMGKLFDVGSTSDEWENVEGETDSIYTFINGQNDKLRFKIRVDSMMDGGEVCTGISEYKIIDGWLFLNPTIASYDNSELCVDGDSTLMHLAFAGEWERIEWYLDGSLIPYSDTDSIWGKELGMYVITAYPELCPTIPHSSGVGPTVKFMPDAEIWENDTVIFAIPELGSYEYQWFYNNEAMDMNTFDIPWIIYKEDLQPGQYTVDVMNPAGCIRSSEPYIVVGIDELAANNIKVYPNPVSTELYVEIGDMKNVESIEIYSITGRLVEKYKVNGYQNIIPMENNPDGMYYVKVRLDDNQSITYKVVKN